MIGKDERRWLILVGFTVLAVTSIPYLLGYMRQGIDWRFTGFLFGVEDGNSYIAKMLSGTYGSFLFRSPYTSMEQRGTLAFLPYLLLGKLAGNPEVHDQLVVLYQLYRWAAGALLFYAIYQFASIYIKNRNLLRITSLSILIGGGLGWLGWTLFPAWWSGRLPLEVYSPEAFGFLALFGLPHLAAARAFLLLGFISFLNPEEEISSYQSAVRGGIFWLVAGFFQPIIIIVGYGVLGIYFLIIFFSRSIRDWRHRLPLFKKCGITGLISSPWIIYNYLAFSGDPYLNVWYSQNLITSPPLFDYIWSFGLFFLAAIPAIVKVLRGQDAKGTLLVAWLISASILAYFPYNVQRRFIDGVWIALIILIAITYEKSLAPKHTLVYKAILALTFASPMLIFLVGYQGAWRVASPVYRPVKEVAMFEFLVYESNPGDVVLATYETSNALPAWAPVRVVAGHGPESANRQKIIPEVESFFSGGQTLDWQRKFLKQHRVKFVIATPKETDTGALDKAYQGLYKKVYDMNGYKVYSVENLFNYE